MRMRVDIIIMQKKEKGKDSEKEQNRKEMYLHTSLFFMFIYKKRKVPKMDIGPPYPQLVEEGSAVGVYSSFLKENNNILKRERSRQA